MITYVKGDLLDNKLIFKHNIRGLAHCCNCLGVMGAGIALQIAKKFPETYRVYKSYCALAQVKQTPILGTVVITEELNNNQQLFVFNMLGQAEPNQSTRAMNYEAMYTALDYSFSVFASEQHKAEPCTCSPKLGIPRLMGCDRAGGEWSIVHAMIEFLSYTHGVDVIIVEFDK